MAKKKRGKKAPKRAPVDVRPGRMPTEKVFADMQKLIEGREFKTRDEMNKFLQEAMIEKKIQPPPAETPIERAQELIYEAWECPSKKERVNLARQALKISKDCADAYILLAEETAKNLDEAVQLYEKAVKAGERALGTQVFEEDAGDFWGILKTRPYMRARAGLAQVLWLLDRPKEAIEHYLDLIRLNPRDNQGLRYLLASMLLEVDMDEDFDELVKKFGEDPSAAWLYPIALREYRRDGPSGKAQAHLAEAVKRNPHVPGYLLGVQTIPKRLPDTYSEGDKNEAVLYAVDGFAAWLVSPGALVWLILHLHGLPPSSPSGMH